MAISKRDIAEVILASESLTSESDYSEKLDCVQFIQKKLSKFDESQISLFEEVSDKLENNPGFRGQFKEVFQEFQKGYFSLPPDKAVKAVQRKRGYHDKGTLAPEDERIRKAIDADQVIDLDFLWETGHPLAEIIFKYLPYRYFTERANDRDYLWLPQMEDFLEEQNWENSDLNEVKSTLYFELEDYLSELTWLGSKLIR